MLDELNTHLPIAESCFNALSMKAAKSTLWSIINCYFVDPNVWKCLNESRYCSNWIAFKRFHKFLFLILHCLCSLNHQHLELSQNYSTFCSTLQAATLCSVNGCCSFVLFNETERWRHRTMKPLNDVVCYRARCSMVRNIYFAGRSRLLRACSEHIECHSENQQLLGDCIAKSHHIILLVGGDRNRVFTYRGRR